MERTLESTILLPNEILNGNLDILEGYVCGTTAPDTLAIHLAGGNSTVLTLDEENTKTVHARLAGTNSRSEVIRPDTVCDPLLLSVNDVVLSVRGELSFAAKVGHITTRIGFRNSKTDSLVSSQNTGENSVHKRLLSELDDWRASDSESTDQVPDKTTAGCARQLVCQQHLVE